MRTFFKILCTFQTCLVAFGAIGAASVLQASAQNITGNNLQGQEPEMDFIFQRYDFGNVYRGQRLSGKFEFTNSGNGVLQIRSIHASCGCMNTRIEPKMEFQPGEKGSVVYEFDTADFVDTVTRTITLDTNMFSSPRVTMNFSAKIKQEITASKPLLSLDEIPQDYSKSFQIPLVISERAKGEGRPPEFGTDVALSPEVKRELTSPDAAVGPIKVLAITSSAPYLKAEMGGGPSNPVLNVTIKGPIPSVGPVRERIIVWNNSTYLRQLVIPVVGEVVGDLTVSSKYLEFGVVTPRKGSQRTLSISSRGKDFRVERVDVTLRQTAQLKGILPDEIIKYSMKKSSDGKSFSLVFDLRYPEMMKGKSGVVNTSGVLVVKTSDQDYKEIRVPFFGVLREE
jgi:hypothetical protein